MDSIKTEIETEENLRKNSEEKKKSHPLLYMQQCMLYDQMDNPKINVHNLTRLYRYDKSKLNIPKFISCFNQVIKHHPCYLTVLHKVDENNCVQIYKPELFKDIELEKMTEKKFNEEILPNILTRFQDNFYDSLLINFRLIETENYLYQFMDHHHIFFDGYSIKLFLENLEKLYMDKPLIEDMYYLRLKELEDMKNDDKYNDMKNYMNSKYNLKEPCGCPKKDSGIEKLKGLSFFKFMIPDFKKKYQNVLGDNDKLYNNFIVLASMCAIGKHANKTDIMVSWSYHGRGAKKEKYIAGNLVRLYPVRIDFKNKMKISDLNSIVTNQSKELLKMLYYPHILDSIDGEIMNNIYQKDLNQVGDFCGIKRERIPTPPRNLEEGIFYNQVIDACYDLTEKGLEVEWQYPFCKFKEETMKEFSELFIKYCDILAEHWNDENEIDVLNLIQ